MRKSIKHICTSRWQQTKESKIYRYFFLHFANWVYSWNVENIQVGFKSKSVLSKGNRNSISRTGVQNISLYKYIRLKALQSIRSLSQLLSYAIVVWKLLWTMLREQKWLYSKQYLVSKRGSEPDSSWGCGFSNSKRLNRKNSSSWYVQCGCNRIQTQYVITGRNVFHSWFWRLGSKRARMWSGGETSCCVILRKMEEQENTGIRQEEGKLTFITNPLLIINSR